MAATESPQDRHLVDAGAEVVRPRRSVPKSCGRTRELQPVTLNGQPLEGVRYHHYTRPETGIRARIAHIPTDSLPQGENRLVVAAIPRPERGATGTTSRFRLAMSSSGWPAEARGRAAAAPFLWTYRG